MWRRICLMVILDRHLLPASLIVVNRNSMDDMARAVALINSNTHCTPVSVVRCRQDALAAGQIATSDFWLSLSALGSGKAMARETAV